MADPRAISLDIETYGACEMNHRGTPLPKQTVFHPRRSLITDGVAPQDLILTVAITLPRYDPRAPMGEQHGGWWGLTDLGRLTPGDSMVFEMWKPAERRRLRQWLLHSDTILGCNLPFDISYLRSDPEFRPLLRPDSHRLIDLMVCNFLHDETRPERSLKSLGPILRTHRYDLEKTIGHKRYPRPTDPAFHHYNAEDTHNTMLAIAELARRILIDYGDPG